jgi:hypothetical protein
MIRRKKMRTIKRYELKEGENRISVSSSAEPLSAGGVGEKIVVWMEEETDDIEKVERPFLVIKEDGEIAEGMVLQWLGVAVMENGEAYHIIEIL